jgi:hypothetical protein
MTSGAVGGIDIIVRKKPGGHQVHMQLVDTGNGTLKVTNLVGGEVADHQRLRQIGGLVGALLTGTPTTINADPRFGQASAGPDDPIKGIGVGLGKPGNPSK